jgi:N-methylhydantoinase B
MGGGAGRNGHTILNPGRPQAEELGKIKVLTMRRGDLLRMVSPSGGGFGDPLERNPELVLRDVLDLLLSGDAARAIYGVVIAGSTVDAQATEVERARRSATRNDTPQNFAFGPAREALEAIWPNEACASLARAVLASPAGLRPYLMASARERLNASNRRVTPAQVEGVIRELLAPLALKHAA